MSPLGHHTIGKLMARRYFTVFSPQQKESNHILWIRMQSVMPKKGFEAQGKKKRLVVKDEEGALSFWKVKVITLSINLQIFDILPIYN